MNEPVIYLDHAATTPAAPEALEAMLPYLKGAFANPASSHHAPGAQARQAVQAARQTLAESLNASTEEIVFTSGATEANNLALWGVARANRSAGRHLVTVSTEHPAVLDPCRWLAGEGYEVTFLQVDSDGMIDLQELERALRSDTTLLSVMAVNNETGVRHPLEQIGRIAREHGVLFHTDATQAFGKIPLDIQRCHIDLLSLSAHKMYGPKGVGALFVRSRDPRVDLQPVLYGGGHERGVRSGTLNVPGIVGLAAATTLAHKRMATDAQQLSQLARMLLDGLGEGVTDIFLNGSTDQRLESIVNISFPGCDSQALMMALPGLAVSSGSACTTSQVRPSHVLTAMGLDEDRCKSALRISLGRDNSADQIAAAVEQIVTAVRKLRSVSGS